MVSQTQLCWRYQSLPLRQRYFTSYFKHLKWLAISFCPSVNSDINCLVQDCSISIANALEILQSCTESSNWSFEKLNQYMFCSFLQCSYGEFAALHSVTTAHCPSRVELFPHVNLHDVQHVALHRRGTRSRNRILSLQLETGCRCWYKWTLSLT